MSVYLLVAYFKSYIERWLNLGFLWVFEMLTHLLNFLLMDHIFRSRSRVAVILPVWYISGRNDSSNFWPSFWYTLVPSSSKINREIVFCLWNEKLFKLLTFVLNTLNQSLNNLFQISPINVVNATVYLSYIRKKLKYSNWLTTCLTLSHSIWFYVSKRSK